MSTDKINAFYKSMQNHYKDLETSAKRTSKTFSTARLMLVVLGGVLLYFEGIRNWAGTPYLLGLIIIIFFLIVRRHKAIKKEVIHHNSLKTLNKDSLNRLAGNWKKHKVTAYLKSATHHEDTAFHDLNVIGDGSLLKYIGTIYTSIGSDTLYSWLKNIGTVSTITKRQDAIKELSQDAKHRQCVQAKLSINTNDLAKNRANYNQIIKWATSPIRNPIAGILPVMLQGYSLLFPLSILLVLLTSPKYILLSFVFFLGNIVVLMLSRQAIAREFEQMRTAERELKSYAFLCKTISDRTYKSDALNQLKSEIVDPEKTIMAHQALKKLSSMAQWSEARLGGLYYLIFNVLTLSDIHILFWMNGWKEENGSHVEKWIKACGQYEVLISLSEIAYNNPEWCYPKLTEATSILARKMGHPLLQNTERVVNDVIIGPEGNFLLVTGSNMSGKSTLLRTLGLNILLSRTGAPVCASHFELPIVDVATSFRIADSLDKGISLFMAELQHIKNIIDLAKTNNQKDVLTVFILDEILQGTNSKERHIAVITIIKELLKNNCIGAISTHDLELASAKNITKVCQTVHFREEIKQTGNSTVMSFDYKLRKGVASTKNALALLEAVGIKSNEKKTIEIVKKR